MKNMTVLAILSLFLICCSHTYADPFGSGVNEFDIEFVTIGDPGNDPDTTGDPNPAGSVLYTYRIGKYEISEQMIDKANAEGGLGITKDTRGPDRPATRISWFEAAKFVNWLNFYSGEIPAYKFDNTGNFQLWDLSDIGYDPNNLFRNSRAKYFLPNVDEWYKAAYYNPILNVYYDYPTGSDNEPTSVLSGTAAGTVVFGPFGRNGPADITSAGGLSPFGTMAQGGNADEWEETEFDFINDVTSSIRGLRGGAWVSDAHSLQSSVRQGLAPSLESRLNFMGFRVASVFIPEPSTAL